MIATVVLAGLLLVAVAVASIALERARVARMLRDVSRRDLTVELLGYRGRYDRPARPAPVDAVAATRLVLLLDGEEALHTIVAHHADRIVRHEGSTLLRDPDGHLLELVVESRLSP